MGNVGEDVAVVDGAPSKQTASSSGDNAGAKLADWLHEVVEGEWDRNINLDRKDLISKYWQVMAQLV